MALFSNGNKTYELIVCVESESLTRSSCLKCIEERLMAAGLRNQRPPFSGRPICFATSCHLNTLWPDNYVTIVWWSKAHTPNPGLLPAISRPAQTPLTLKAHTPYPALGIHHILTHCTSPLSDVTTREGSTRFHALLSRGTGALTSPLLPFFPAPSPLFPFCQKAKTNINKFPTFRVTQPVDSES